MIVTFYSYKGGVGRTQLAVNLANYFCFYGSKKVLLIDWDLEAPGLHNFFSNFDEAKIKFGLIELLIEYVKQIRKGDIVNQKDLPFFDKKHIYNLTKSKNSGKVDFIPAGNYNQYYIEKVNEFDWFEFYEKLDGKVYIEFLKTKLKEHNYDYIFIDSRTGISDYSGICNIQMPELNVLVIAPTNQNFKGCLKVANSILESGYVKSGTFRNPYILPILSRLDRESDKADIWIDKFKSTFGFLIDFMNLFENNVDNYVLNTFLEYTKVFSIGENLLFTDSSKKVSVVYPLAKNYENIANYIEKIKKPSIDVFISYAWGNESENVVNNIFDGLKKYNANIIRDKINLGYKGGVNDFMNKIGRTGFIIIIISDKYLKSENCMYELVQIQKKGNSFNRIFPIVLSDADIYKPMNRLKYVKYWEDKIKDVNNALKDINDMSVIAEIQRELMNYREILNTFANILNILKDMNTLTPEMHKDNDFKILIESIDKLSGYNSN